MPDKTYKERNGTTRVGDALRWLAKSGKKIAPELLDIAGNVTGIDALEKLANKIKGNKELSEFDKKMLQEQINLDKVEMQEITKRWQADMTSDSWASKNIRPYSLAFLTFMTVIIILLESSISNFQVEDAWRSLLEKLLITAYTVYFGVRGFEKYTKMKRK